MVGKNKIKISGYKLGIVGIFLYLYYVKEITLQSFFKIK